MAEFALRAGIERDAPALLGLWDGAIAWLVARGQSDQWGTEPASARARSREWVQQWVRGPRVTIAEREGRMVSVIMPARPDHVPAIERSETYHLFRGQLARRCGA